MLLSKQRLATARSPSSRWISILEVCLDAVWQFRKVLGQAKRKSSVDFVALELARQVADRGIEWRIRRDGKSGEALQAGRGEDVDLDAGGVEGVVGGGGCAMEDEDGEVAEERIGGMVDGDGVWRERQLVGDSNHDGIGEIRCRESWPGGLLSPG